MGSRKTCVLRFDFISRHPRRAVAAQVTLASLRSSMYRARNERFPNIPGSLLELANLRHQDENRGIHQTLDGVDYLFAGDVTDADGCTHLIFITETMLEFLRENAAILFSDGTFDSRPGTPECSQVFCILTVWDENVSLVATLTSLFSYS